MAFSIFSGYRLLKLILSRFLLLLFCSGRLLKFKIQRIQNRGAQQHADHHNFINDFDRTKSTKDFENQRSSSNISTTVTMRTALLPKPNDLQVKQWKSPSSSPKQNDSQVGQLKFSSLSTKQNDSLVKKLKSLSLSSKQNDPQVTKTIFPSLSEQNRSRAAVSKSFVPSVKKEEVLSEEPISSEEKTYYNGCKQYYHLTKMPLVSISDEILNNNSQIECLSFKFVIDEDYDEFNLETFLNKTCSLLNIDRNDIHVRKIQKGSVILYFDRIVKKISNVATEIKLQVRSIYDTLTDRMKKELGKLKVFFMFMGDIKTCADKSKLRYEIKLYPEYNKTYGIDRTYWTGALNDGRDRGDSPYYCPLGWSRYSFYVCENFDQKFKGWCICYHGTKFHCGLSILLSGLKPATDTAHGGGIYTSPSIIYACHPRYSEVKKIEIPESNGFFKNGHYVQFVLQCRVHPRNRKLVGSETLKIGDTVIDPNISNNIIEWVIDTKGKDVIDFNDPDASIICTSLLIRVTDSHPGLLTESDWWYKSISDYGSCFGLDPACLKEQKKNKHMCHIIYE